MERSDLVAPRRIPERQEVLTRRYGKLATIDYFEQPDGRVDEFLLWRAEKSPTMIFPVTEAGKVLLVRQFCYAAEEFFIEVPGGNPKEGESPEEGAVAELEEETGYRAERMVQLGSHLWIEPHNTAVPFTAFLACGCRRVKDVKPDATEVLEVCEFDLDAWIKLCMGGGIPQDSKSIALTFLALPHLGCRLIGPQGCRIF